MLIYTKDKYISTHSNVFEIAMPSGGYLFVSKDVYDDCLVLFTTNIEDKAKKLGVTGEALELVLKFANDLPDPITVLAPLLGMLKFKPDYDIELLCGICHIITMTHSTRRIWEMDKEEFAKHMFSDYITKEYILPRKIFLSSCIPYDEMTNPEKLSNKHNFLVLAPYGAGGVPMPAMPDAGAAPTPQPGGSIFNSEDDPEDYRYYIKRKDKYMYFGDGCFCHAESGDMIEIEIYDEPAIEAAFGIKEPESLFQNPVDQIAEEQPAPVAAKPVDQELIADDNTAVQRSAVELFARERGRRVVGND